MNGVFCRPTCLGSSDPSDIYHQDLPLELQRFTVTVQCCERCLLRSDFTCDGNHSPSAFWVIVMVLSVPFDNHNYPIAIRIICGDASCLCLLGKVGAFYVMCNSIVVRGVNCKYACCGHCQVYGTMSQPHIRDVDIVRCMEPCHNHMCAVGIALGIEPCHNHMCAVGTVLGIEPCHNHMT